MSVSSGESIQALLAQGDQVSVVALLDALVLHGLRSHASDIHLDPTHQATRVRFRIDGQLEDIAIIPQTLHAALISRVKIVSSLRTDEHQTCQDGRFRTAVTDKQVDIRVAVGPTYHGERAVLRLLVQTDSFHTLTDLGMSEHDAARVQTATGRPHGMILASGPTGSGKTTTLYALLKLIHSPAVSVVTIEDPVEYDMVGTNQMQVNTKTQLTFATGLRSILRQDPNVIMVGEIRDAETARLAVNTALTGHLLFSTIHTNDAATTLLRFLDLGVESYLVASTVNVIIAQRLLRTICVNCVQEETVDVGSLPRLLGQLREVGSGSVRVYRGNGCESCRNSGYSGRTGIFEVLTVTPAVRALIYRKTPVAEIVRVAIQEGMTTMALDGWGKVLRGQTTLAELMRVLSD